MSVFPKISPFRGVRYNLDRIKDVSLVVAPPYDVISSKRQEELYQLHPYNVIRLILGKKNQSDGENDNQYTRAARDWNLWQKENILIRDPHPSIYIYHQEFNVPGQGRVVRKGFLALKRLEDFEEGGVKPHEKTIEGPKADRLKLMKACQSNFSPIFGLYASQDSTVSDLISLENREKSLIDISDLDGVRHCLWKLEDSDVIQSIVRSMTDRTILIADGHHRYETALNYRNWIKGKGKISDDSPVHYVLMYFADMGDPGMLVFPTHRMLRRWPKFHWLTFLSLLRKNFEVEVFKRDHKEDFLKILKDKKSKDHVFGVVSCEDPQHFYLLTLNDNNVLHHPGLQDIAAPLRCLDAGILHHLILKKLLEMSEEQQRDPQYMDFIKEEQKAWEQVEETDVQCLFLMKAPEMKQIQEVADAGLIMPPKTTYFYPKLLSGLVFNKIDLQGE